MLKGYKRLLIGLAIFFPVALLLVSHPGKLALTWLENHLGSKVVSSQYAKPCPDLLAAHGGYGHATSQNTNSRAALRQAIEDDVRHIEIDVFVAHNYVGLGRVDPGLEATATEQDYTRRNSEHVSYGEFLSAIAPHFAKVAIDIKEVVPSRPHAASLLSHPNLNPSRDLWIGLDCRLLKRLQNQTGLPTGCEAYGVIANGLSGFTIWSANQRLIRQPQTALARQLNLRPLLWSYGDPNDAYRHCDLNPLLLLVDSSL